MPTNSHEVVFLTARATSHIGSTACRAYQLSQILNDVAKAPVSEVVESLPFGLARPMRNKIVVVNKWAMYRLKLPAINMLFRNNLVILDPVDGKLPESATGNAHAILSCSFDALGSLRAKYKDLRIDFLPHHVNTQVPAHVAQQDSFFPAYFGEPDNLLHRHELEVSGGVAIVETPTGREPERSWTSQIPLFSAHVAVRRHRDFDGTKFFYKGAFAARAGAVIVTPRTENDVEYFLGADFPFLARSEQLDDVLEALEAAREGFGGAEWKEALSRMQEVKARTSPEEVGRLMLRLVEAWRRDL